MNRPGAARGWLVGLAVVAMAVLLGYQPIAADATTAPLVTPSAPSGSQGPSSSQSPVSVTLNQLNPASPDAQKLSQRVDFTVTIKNNSTTTYTDVTLGLQRGLPITQQKLLDSAITQPPETDYHVPNPLELKGSLAPGQVVHAVYRTTTEQLCMCFGGIYPYALVVHATGDANAGSVEVGRQQVLIPSFLATPKTVNVAWVWPLLDRPHRGLGDRVFTDDDLAAEITTGGRLDRALKVAELVQGKVRLSLVVDPDLLDSLAVMASPAGYTVGSGAAAVRGTGGQLAADWLARFKAVQADNDLVLTPYADPDIDAITRAGMTWSNSLDAQVRARISPYLGGLASDLLSWPAGGVLTNNALDALVSGGSSTVLLGDVALPGQNQADSVPDALSPLPSAAGGALALVTDSAITATFDRLVAVNRTAAGNSATNDRQTLLSQLAIRAEQNSDQSHFAVIAPDRYVDPDPAATAGAMLAVGGTGWSASISVEKALDTVTPVNRGALQTAAANPSDEISSQTLAGLLNVQNSVSAMNDALGNDGAAELLGGFSNAIQRAESSAWRRDPSGEATALARLQSTINGLMSRIHLIQPANGTYSGSANQPVVVTVANQLPRPIKVRVSVAPASGGMGFRSSPIPLQTIPADSNAVISIPTHVDRLGKVQVVATLATPDGTQLGETVTLRLHATAIGGVSKTITIVAVSVLVLALLRRLVRWIRRRRRPLAPAGG